MLDSTFIVFLVFLFPVHSMLIHKRMTREEVYGTFQTTHDQVPDYQVVPVFHTLHKRNAASDSIITVRVQAFMKKVKLYLEPNIGILADISTPVWTVTPNRRNFQNIEYTYVPNAFEKVGRPYHDLSKRSSVVVYEGDDGKTLMIGNLHSDIVIRPLPHRFRQIVSRGAKNLNDSLLNSMKNGEKFHQTHHHIVFRRLEPDVNSAFKVVKRDRNNNESANNRSKRSVPGVIYPEILVIVDYSLYWILGENIQEATRYILALWNGVDLRYRLLENPMIRLNIAGIIISLRIGGTPYLDNYRRGSKEKKETELDADLALAAMSRYFYEESWKFNFASYDMAIALTRLDMCNVIFNHFCDASTLGYAYEWGACNRSHVDRNTEAVGIVEDNGGFKAIIAAAHEIAHLMGVSHDGFEDSASCPGHDGFLMSSVLHSGENSLTWSDCSLRNLAQFFRSKQATCLFNEPQHDVPLRRILPGKLQTLDEQCEKIDGTKACYHDQRVCSKLECYIPGRGKLCISKIPAAEGSTCGNKRQCINGICVHDNSLFVPYKTRTTPLFH